MTIDIDENDLESSVALYVEGYEKMIGRKATENDIENIRKKIYDTKKKSEREQDTELQGGSVYSSWARLKEFFKRY